MLYLHFSHTIGIASTFRSYNIVEIKYSKEKGKIAQFTSETG